MDHRQVCSESVSYIAYKRRLFSKGRAEQPIGLRSPGCMSIFAVGKGTITSIAITIQMEDAAQSMISKNDTTCVSRQLLD